MPNRIIKESICTSDTIDRLSWFDEVVFYRLIVNCDDYGRFDGRGAILKSRLFPLRGGISERSIRDAVRRLQAAGLVFCYQAEGRPYLQLTTWDKHQQVRAKKSKYPAFESGAAEAEDMAPQKQSRKENLPELFAKFWAAYPKKSAKARAEEAFYKIAPEERLVERMLGAIAAQKGSREWKKERGQFIPYPATWLSQRRWEDEPCVPEEEDGLESKIFDPIEEILRQQAVRKGEAGQEICGLGKGGQGAAHNMKHGEKKENGQEKNRGVSD